MSYQHPQTIRDDETLYMTEFRARLKLSESQTSRLLKMLEIEPLFKGTGFAQMNGYIYNRAVARKQLECLENQNDDDETK